MLSTLRGAVACLFLTAASLRSAPSDEPWKPSTRIALARGEWVLNGKKTYPGSRAEGLLLNVRMVNATFEDRNPASCPKGFDPDKNAEAFVARIPEYVAQGVLAFTLCLQGGSPNYQGALNSAFDPEGSLRPDSLKRVASVIEACDRSGAVVILGCFYQEQDQVLKDVAAVRKAVTGAASWIKERGYTNVLLEIANEFPHAGFNHALIRDPSGIAELIRIAKQTHPALLVSASGMGGGRLDHRVATVADFILLHFNGVAVDDILERVASADKTSKAIVCNEDAKTGAEGAGALQAAVNALASYGYANFKQNQYYPFKFEGAADDPIVYARFKELTARREK